MCMCKIVGFWGLICVECRGEKDAFAPYRTNDIPRSFFCDDYFPCARELRKEGKVCKLSGTCASLEPSSSSWLIWTELTSYASNFWAHVRSASPSLTFFVASRSLCSISFDNYEALFDFRPTIRLGGFFTLGKEHIFGEGRRNLQICILLPPPDQPGGWNASWPWLRQKCGSRCLKEEGIWAIFFCLLFPPPSLVLS